MGLKNQDMQIASRVNLLKLCPLSERGRHLGAAGSRNEIKSLPQFLALLDIDGPLCQTGPFSFYQ